MNCERKAIQDSLVLGASIGLGITALLMLVAGCSPVASHPIPPPIESKSVVVAMESATHRAAMIASLPSPSSLMVKGESPPLIAAPEPIQKRGTLRLQFSPVTNAAAAGYRAHFGLISSNYTHTADLGRVTNATVTGLDEGRSYYFAVAAYSTAGEESPLSNEASGTTSVFVSIRQDRWSVSSSGLIGVTNKMQQSTNLSDWWTVLEWIGTGATTNYLHTNVVQSWFRVR
jgi:hypothetical protein